VSSKGKKKEKRYNKPKYGGDKGRTKSFKMGGHIIIDRGFLKFRGRKKRMFPKFRWAAAYASISSEVKMGRECQYY
jgi:hypothetical protein